MPEKFIQPEASFRPVDWVKEQTKEELDTLRPVVERTSFGKVENGNVVYNMDDVKDYLEKKKDLSWESLTKRNSWVLIMAVQIALKKLGYDFGKVDWILADKGKTVSKTKNAIKAFQQANSLSPDGIPGPKTITKIVEALNALPQQQWRTPPVFKSYWPQK